MSDSWILTEMPCMAHTPGPWEIHHHGDNEGDIHGSDGKLVCMMREGDTAPAEDWESDARLIAAAPDMWMALRGALRVLTGWDGHSTAPDDGDTEVVREIKEALRKADTGSRFHDD
jgi:hypothetical protein